MTLRLVQHGIGATRPFVATFLAWAGMDAKIRAAFGPAPCIVADDSAKGTETLAEIMEFAHKTAGVSLVPKLALERGGPPEAPVISRDGQLWMYSYATAEADMKAHSYQAMVVQPKLAAQHVAPWLLNGPQPSPTPTKEPARTASSGGGIDEGLVLGGLAFLARKLL